MILIQPRISDESIAGELHSDVFALMLSGRPLIIEVEDSTGQKFTKDGPRHRESSLRDTAVPPLRVDPVYGSNTPIYCARSGGLKVYTWPFDNETFAEWIEAAAKAAGR